MGVFLKEASLKPHKSAYWLNPTCTQEELAIGSQAICEVYHEAKTNWELHGTKTVSTDEKTGIQALERQAPDLPLQQGRIRRIEYNYERHGTQCLIANWDILEGKIIAPTVSDTRTEIDFCKHIEQLVNSDASVKKWAIVLDQLNTHKSESLVRYVANLMPQNDIDLGVKEESGVLKNMASRAEFLANKEHPVYFIYTPKHCSWLNQVETWFSIFYRKLLKNNSFKSKEELKNKIINFIQYFNDTMAKPFKWTFKGMPLTV